MNFSRSFLIPLLAFCAVRPSSAEVKVTPLEDRVRVEIDGKLFTEMVLSGSEHVYYWPLIGPGGVKMTRSWPMENPPGEEHDHPHHRSMWFSHGLVNGMDFWTEDSTQAEKVKADPNLKKRLLGKIVHEKTLQATGGAEEGVVKTAERWVMPDGSVPVTSVQTLRVYQRPASGERLFDFEITLTAGAADVLFGDTKEGTFALRIAESMRFKQPKNKPGEGHFLTSEGVKDGDAWGKRARWVEASGPVEGKTLGIAIFDHPANFGAPTRWHARVYGLFAANPFCQHDMDSTQAAGSGGLKLAAGKSTTFKYRISIHEGAGDAAKLEEQFKAFAATK